MHTRMKMKKLCLLTDALRAIAGTYYFYAENLLQILHSNLKRKETIKNREVKRYKNKKF